jgi:hypothetical protein
MSFVRVVDDAGVQRFLNTNYIIQLAKANKAGDWHVHMAANGEGEPTTLLIPRDSGDILLKEVRENGG